jgi:16S rRNA (uracil1498-N3)-methyltransferase
MPRIYTPQALHSGASIALDAAASRHVQVLRMQPGMLLSLFNGRGGEYAATVEHMGRSEVRVQVGEHFAVERELAREVHIAIGMPANERMDWLLEKATELGAASIQPLMTERSVLRLSKEQAAKKRERWQQQAVAACEQCGRNRVPSVEEPLLYEKWLDAGVFINKFAINNIANTDSTGMDRSFSKAVLSLHSGALSAAPWLSSHPSGPCLFLAGPEGGLSAKEEQLALDAGFSPLSLGARVLRSETAPLAVLAAVSLVSH